MSDRRTFLEKSALLSAGLILSPTDWIFSAESELTPIDRTNSKPLAKVRDETLDHIESMRITGKPFGSYRYSETATQPTLYSSTYAAMTRHLYHDLDLLSKSQKGQWVDLLQSHQDDDGLFRDPVIFGSGWYKNDPLWCGRPHLTCHVVTALRCLGVVANKPLRWLEPFLDLSVLDRWLEERDWGKQVAWTGNEVLNVGTLLQYARDFQNNKRCDEAVKLIRRWMTDRCDSKTGLWGVDALDLEKPTDRSQAVQAAYHFWLLWFYDEVPIPYAEKALSEVLKTQNPQGGFGWGVHNKVKIYNSSACEDIDSIDPLARLFDSTEPLGSNETNRAKIHGVLSRAVPWVLANQTNHGSFSFMRNRPFSYGNPQLAAQAGAGGMFPTWFRTLTLAYLGKAIPNSDMGRFDWQFCDCPGIQFWQR